MDGGDGIDWILTNASVSLDGGIVSNVENIVLTGTDSLSGYGDADNNWIIPIFVS